MMKLLHEGMLLLTSICIQYSQVGRLKLARVGVFTLWNLANPTNWDLDLLFR